MSTIRTYHVPDTLRAAQLFAVSLIDLGHESSIVAIDRGHAVESDGKRVRFLTLPKTRRA